MIAVNVINYVTSRALTIDEVTIIVTDVDPLSTRRSDTQPVVSHQSEAICTLTLWRLLSVDGEQMRRKGGFGI